MGAELLVQLVLSLFFNMLISPVSHFTGKILLQAISNLNSHLLLMGIGKFPEGVDTLVAKQIL